MSKVMQPTQDWTTKTINSRPKLKKAANPEQIANHARQSGYIVEAVKKTGTINAQSTRPVNSRALDEETEQFHLPSVELDLRLRIQKARQAKGWTQKQLAQAINEKSTVVNEYESGKAIPNNQILGKMERALGAKIRGSKKRK